GNAVLNGGMGQGPLLSDNSHHTRIEGGHEPHQDTPYSHFPRIIYYETGHTRGANIGRLKSRAYLRLRNIQLGYTFDKPTLARLQLSSLRIFVSGNNLLTITNYKGLDPDFINNDVWDRGTDNMAFPNPRTVMMGLQLSF